VRGRLLLAFVVRLSGNRLHMCLSKVRCCHPARVGRAQWQYKTADSCAATADGILYGAVTALVYLLLWALPMYKQQTTPGRHISTCLPASGPTSTMIGATNNCNAVTARSPAAAAELSCYKVTTSSSRDMHPHAPMHVMWPHTAHQSLGVCRLGICMSISDLPSEVSQEGSSTRHG